jgi:hypothetical protein
MLNGDTNRQARRTTTFQKFCVLEYCNSPHVAVQPVTLYVSGMKREYKTHKKGLKSGVRK